MQEMWKEDPEERPDFGEIVLSLANLMHYSGDIESDLIAETRNCRKVKKEHNYHELELTAFPQNREGPYSMLEEPVYHNYSRDESLDSPEEYEVPQPVLSSCDGESSHAEYEVPVMSSQDAESAKSVDLDTVVVPMEYEIPQSEMTKKTIPNGRNGPNHIPQRSLTYHNKFPATAETTKKANNSPRPDRSSQSSPARHMHKPPGTGPVNIRNAKEYDQAMDRKTRAVSPGYLRLNYPKADSVPSSSANFVSTPDGPYSTLEWKKGADVTNCHSLPHRFTHKNHVYHTMEFEPKHSQ